MTLAEAGKLLESSSPDLEITGNVSNNDSEMRQRGEMYAESHIIAAKRRISYPFVDCGQIAYLFNARLPLQTPALGKKVVGFCSLEKYSKGVFGMSVVVHPDYSNRKIATALVATTAEFARENDEINELVAVVKPGSYSERVFKRLGFPFCREWRINDYDANVRNIYKLNTS